MSADMGERVRLVIEMDIQPTITAPDLQRQVETVTPEKIRDSVADLLGRRFGLHEPISVDIEHSR